MKFMSYTQDFFSKPNTKSKDINNIYEIPFLNLWLEGAKSMV